MRDAAPVGGWGFKVAEESWLLCRGSGGRLVGWGSGRPESRRGLKEGWAWGVEGSALEGGAGARCPPPTPTEVSNPPS